MGYTKIKLKKNNKFNFYFFKVIILIKNKKS